LNTAEERFTVDLGKKLKTKEDFIEKPGMSSNNMDLLETGGGVNEIEVTPTKEEKADALSERKRSSTEMSKTSIDSVNTGASTASTDSSPAKKKMEAMKNKHPNASKSNQVVPIASLFLGNPR
jgi:activator of HSP90 ATPase